LNLEQALQVEYTIHVSFGALLVGEDFVDHADVEFLKLRTASNEILDGTDWLDSGIFADSKLGVAWIIPLEDEMSKLA
jgi:hypothetical protein